MKISIICVYNKKEQFNSQLYNSLLVQNVDYELIAIDNTDNKYKTAASALNYGAEQSSGDILIFSHQDIYFKRNDELKKLADKIAECEIGTIVGTQGVVETSRVYYTNLTSGDIINKNIINNYNEQLYEVSCVDEGLFGMKRETWISHKFNEQLCDNWHLYCVEVCLYARKFGHKVYVYPSQIHHFSHGKINLAYMKNLKLLCKVYRKDFKYIWTTCYKVRTNSLYINTLVCLWTINRILHGNLK